MIVAPRQRPGPSTVSLGRTQARLVWFAIAAGLALLVVGSLAGASLVPPAPAPGPGDLLLLVGAPVALADLALGYFVASRIRKSAPAGAPPDGIAATQVIVGSATALSAAAVACVFFFVSRQQLLLLLVVPAAAVLLHWYPSESRWEALLPAPAPGQPPRRSMMRG